MNEPQLAIGDDAGEHVRMKRGQYSATAYVIGAAVVQWLIALAFLQAGFDELLRGRFGMLPLLLGGLVAAGYVAATYWGRWRVIEAFASRFCVGVANISVFTAGAAAFFYAHTRLAARIVRQEKRLVSEQAQA
jgi:hypothetical protein